jgi:hypothetical protein
MQYFWGITCGKHHAFYVLMSPHRKRDERYLCVEVFSQELEAVRQEPFKHGENHKLGDVKTPLDYTLSVCIRLLFVFSINAVLPHKLGASFIVSL